MKRPIAVPALLLVAVLAQACDRPPTEAALPPEGLRFTLSSATDTFPSGALSNYTLHNTPGAWSVSSGRLVGDASARQSVATRNGLTIADGWVETVTSNAADGGLVMRFLDGANYYLLALRDDSRFGHANIQFHKFVNGSVVNLSGQYDISWPANTQKTVRFEASGATLSAYVDSVLIVQVTDSSFTSGGAGLRASGRDGETLVSRFDEFRWGGSASQFYTDPFHDNTLPSYTRLNTTSAWSISGGRLVADSSARQSLVLRDSISFADGWVETVTSNAADGGLVLRVADADNYYLLAIRDDSRFGHANIQMHGFVNGVPSELTSQLDLSWPANTQKTVRFEAEGATLRAYVDGTLVQTVTDSSHTSGRAGLRSNGRPGENLSSRFDLFRWFY